MGVFAHASVRLLGAYALSVFSYWAEGVVLVVLLNVCRKNGHAYCDVCFRKEGAEQKANARRNDTH